MSEQENIQKIIGRIQADAKSKMDAITAEKQSKLDEVKRETDERIASERAGLDEDFAKETARIGRRMNSAARLEAKRMLLQSREVVIEQVLDGVAKRLKGMPAQDYKEFLQSAIQTAKREMGDDMVVHCRQGDRALVAQCAGAGLRLDYRELKQDAIGGVLIESKKTGSLMNFLFDDIMDRERPLLREEIGKVLYSDGEGEVSSASGVATEDRNIEEDRKIDSESNTESSEHDIN